MLGKILVISSIVLVVYSETRDHDADWDRYPKKKPYHHHHYDPYYLFYGGSFLYYLAFVLIKFKIIFVLGAIIVGALFAGKLFALIKYSEHIKSSDYHHKPEKIYIESVPTPHHHHHDVIPYNSPPSSIGGYETLPPNAQIDYGPNKRQLFYN